MSEQNPLRTGRPPRLDVYQRLDTQIAELWQRMGGLPNPLEAAGIWRGIWFEEAHHSTAIEGNTLVLKQVEALLAEGRAVGDKQLREYMEVRGYADAAEWVYRQAITPGAWSDGQALTLTEVRQVHRMAMTPVWDVEPHADSTPGEAPGNFREHDIQPFPGGMTPPSWVLVPVEVDGWLTDVNSLAARTADFAERLAALHARFERVHPFLDGNGRTGRLLMNLVLVRLGYPPAIIYKRQRVDYLRALRRADAGDAGLLGELLARAVLDNLYRFVVPAVAGPARLVPLAALATSEVNADALRVAANRGRLQATRGGDGQWRSSRNWVNEYLEGRWRRAE
jgi:fido (protein-threonine AMPylation protein)